MYLVLASAVSGGEVVDLSAERQYRRGSGARYAQGQRAYEGLDPATQARGVDGPFGPDEWTRSALVDVLRDAAEQGFELDVHAEQIAVRIIWSRWLAAYVDQRHAPHDD